MKKKIVLFSVLAVFAVIAVIAVPSVSATYPANAIYLELENSNGLYCENNTLVEVWVNANVVTTGVQTDIYFDPTCVNITDVDYTGSAWPPLAPPGWTHWGDHVRLLGTNFAGAPAGDKLFATIRLHCVKEEYCISGLEFLGVIVLDSTATPIDITAYDGTFTCEIQEKPDLEIEKSVEVGADGNFVVSYTVTNIGGGDAGPSTTCKYLNGELQETQTCPALAPEETYSDAFNPEECPCGETLNVTVCADNDDVVDESDEENNCEVNIVECPYIPTPPIEIDIRADGIASNIFDATDYSICPGTVTEDGITIDNETAMGALVIYCQNNGINVQITMGTLGEYVVQIGNDPTDNNSWSYAVNEEVPPVGGAQKVIVDGDRVHWYNYNLNYYSVLTAIDKTEIVVGETLTATVTWKSIAGTDFLNGASVHVGTMGPWGPEPGLSVGTTGVDGTCTFPWSTVGTWGVYAVDPVHDSGIYNYPPVSFTCSTEEKPDLVVEKKWEEWVNETHYSVSYVIFNSGTAIAPRGHNTTLYVDSVEIEHKRVPVDLAPGDNYTDTFDTVIACTGNLDTIKVCADNYEVIDELDETNNCMTNEFTCEVPLPGPDLVITDIRENDGTIWFKIENRGTEEAGSSHTALYVNGAYQARKKVGSLDSGESKELYFRYVYTPGTDDIVEVCADSGNEVAESNEGNNCKELIPGGKPDLVIEDKWEEWVNETHYTVTYTIHNKGTAIAPACHNTTLYVDGVAIEHKHVPVALAYCETYTDTFDTTIACTGYSDIIRVCADNYDVIDELDETNNCLVNVWSCEEGKPDLVIEDKWEEWVNETHYSVTYTIHNKGTAIAPACHNTTLYVDGVAIEHKHVPVALAYCETYTDTFDTTIECTGDSDIILVCADNYEVIDELDETNNCMTNNFRCVGPLPGPDLVITDIRENDGTIWFKIENRGTEEAGSSYTALYVNGAYQARKKVGSFDSGETTELYFRYVYTPGTDDIVKVCADISNDVAESNEKNNCRTVILECDRRS